MTDTCKTCRWWKPDPYGIGDIGSCHWPAPPIIQMLAERDASLQHFPMMEFKSCGAHKPKEQS